MEVVQRHVANVGKIPRHVDIAQLNDVFTVAEMLDEFGDQEFFVLPASGIIERPAEDDRQLVKISRGDMFKAGFAATIMIHRLNSVLFRNKVA